MIHVRFKRSKHPTMAVDYLLGIDRNRKDAKVVKGDIDLSLEIAQQSEHKNKYSCGCLSFEEADLSDETKHKIMEHFEKSLFPGLGKNQYDVSWVQHTDKGRLELNYFIPQVELKSGKSLTAYYHKTDRDLMRDFVEYTNLYFNLTNPNDHPPDATRLNWSKRTPPEVKATGERIAREIIDKYPDVMNEPQSMTIKALGELGYKIAKRKSGKNKGVQAITRDSISIINPDNPDGPNIRLKGALFNDRTPVKKPTENEVLNSLRQRMKIKAERQMKRYPNKLFNNREQYERARQNQSIIDRCSRIIANPIKRTIEAEQNRQRFDKGTNEKAHDFGSRTYREISRFFKRKERPGKTIDCCSFLQRMPDLSARNDNKQSIQPLSNKP